MVPNICIKEPWLAPSHTCTRPSPVSHVTSGPFEPGSGTSTLLPRRRSAAEVDPGGFSRPNPTDWLGSVAVSEARRGISGLSHVWSFLYRWCGRCPIYFECPALIAPTLMTFLGLCVPRCQFPRLFMQY